MRSFYLLFIAFSFAPSLLAAPPRSLDDRLTIELFAAQPQIVTPTGIDVAADGRVWVIECNTHFPPEGYAGHPTDRVLILQDTNGDGRAEEPKVFADGFTHAMSIAVRPVWMDAIRLESDDVDAAKNPEPHTQVFLATRREILLLEDIDGDDFCDRQTRLAWLETEGNYPHNGLAGFAFDADGSMYFGFGENLGADYTLHCRNANGAFLNANGAFLIDRNALKGGGEGGNMYRMRPDGTQLSRWATGFWNPHASCVDAFGRLFTVDNDPDSRPPCRLLHIIEEGDYGFRFRNGRKGLHPFTSWNGEIPGTLPMVAGTGEAPSGILAYEHGAFPEEYLGNLLVTSWGDHRIDRFRLQPKGASFESIAEPVIVGDEDFRPVGIALAPDGSLYCTDWVMRDYKVHGHGRVWRIRAKDAPDANSPREQANDFDALVERLESNSLTQRRVAARKLTRIPDGQALLKKRLADYQIPVRQRIEILWAIANTPTEVHDFELQPVSIDSPEQAPVASAFDEVAAALVPLIGTPQFMPSWWEVDFSDDENLTDEETEMPDTREYESHTWLRNRPIKLIQPEEYNRFLLQLFLQRTDTYGELRWETWNRQNNDTEFNESYGEVCYESYTGKIDPFVTSACVKMASSMWFPPRMPSGEPPLEAMVTQYGECSLGQYVVRERHYMDRVSALLAMRRRGGFESDLMVRLGLTDPSPIVRRLAIQWVAEENLTQHRGLVELNLKSNNMTSDLFLATLAALEMLDGKAPQDFDKTPPGKYVLPLLADANTPAAVKRQALRLIDPADPALTTELLEPMLRSEDQQLRLEVLRTLAGSPLPEAPKWLSEAAVQNDKDRSVERMTAITGLAAHANEDVARQTLVALLDSPLAEKPAVFRSLRELAGKDDNIKQQILRSVSKRTGQADAWTEIDAQLALLQGGPTVDGKQFLLPNAPARPASEEAWIELFYEEDSTASAFAGEQVFFHPNGPGCFKCHTVDGRGGRIGPDLTSIGLGLHKSDLVAAILKPSKEVSPQFTTWNMATHDGRTLTGMLVYENLGETTLGNEKGELTTIQTVDIEARTPVKTSVMPEKLEDHMTVREFQDLIEFLANLK